MLKTPFTTVSQCVRVSSVLVQVCMGVCLCVMLGVSVCHSMCVRCMLGVSVCVLCVYLHVCVCVCVCVHYAWCVSFQ